MKYLHTFENYIYEGYMSELDLMAKEAKSLEDFKKEAVKEYPKLKGMKGLDQWLEEIYQQAIKD